MLGGGFVGVSVGGTVGASVLTGALEGGGSASVGFFVGGVVGCFVVGVLVGATAQILFSKQVSELQSESFTQVLPPAHPGQTPPPQSTSVSKPSRTPFEQTARVGGAVVGAFVGSKHRV